MEDEGRPLTPEEFEAYIADLRKRTPPGSHSTSWVTPNASGRRYFAECVCGWRSTTRIQREDAQSAAAHHYRLEMQARRVNGDRSKPLPLKLVSTNTVRRSA